MTDRQPYSRVYWSIRTDPKFESIYGDDHHLATWLRLLIAADATWPAPADLPATARKASVKALSDAGLIDLLPSGMFKVHGLDAERGRRGAGPGRPPNPPGLGPKPDPLRPQPGPKPVPNGKTAEDEPSQGRDEDEPRTGGARAPDPADVYWTLTGRYPNDRPLTWIDELTSKYGAEATIRAIATAHAADRNISTLLGRAGDLLKAEARALNVKEQAEERDRLAAKRSEPRIVPDRDAVNAELRRLMGLDAA